MALALRATKCEEFEMLFRLGSLPRRLENYEWMRAPAAATGAELDQAAE